MIVDLFTVVVSAVGSRSQICPWRWFGQHLAPAGIIISLEINIWCLISTGTTMSFGPGLLQMQQEECPLAELGNGSCTEGGLTGVTDG